MNYKKHLHWADEGIFISQRHVFYKNSSFSPKNQSLLYTLGNMCSRGIPEFEECMFVVDLKKKLLLEIHIL
jgi:hypothetical protein